MKPFILILGILLLPGCNSIPRPNTDICITNVTLLQQKCLNLLDDYDSNGKILAGHTPKIRQFTEALDLLNALNKSASTDPVGWGNLKAYFKELRSAN